MQGETVKFVYMCVCTYVCMYVYECMNAC